MKIAELIHDADHPAEPSNVDLWAEEIGAVTKRYGVFRGDYPDLNETDLLILHGGAQHVWDKETGPWLVGELAFVRQAVEAGVPVIGFCLGSQIIAEAFGGSTFSAEKETGFYSISPYTIAAGHPLLRGFQQGFETFLWHGDHFTLPERFSALAYSKATPNQIIAGTAVPAIGIQFHPEYTIRMIRSFVETNRDEPWEINGSTMDAEAFIRELLNLPETYLLFKKLIGNALNYFRDTFPVCRF